MWVLFKELPVEVLCEVCPEKSNILGKKVFVWTQLILACSFHRVRNIWKISQNIIWHIILYVNINTFPATQSTSDAKTSKFWTGES